MKKLLLLTLLLCGISQAWASSWTDGNGIGWFFNVEGGNATDIYPVHYPSGNVVIPEKVRYGGRYLTVKSIGRRAFQNNYNMTSVTIPSSVTNLGYEAFIDCTGLTSVTISEGVTSIGGSAFSGCSGLTSISIPSSVTSIGWFAFNGCLNLLHIYCYAVSCPEVNITSFSEYSSNLYVPSVSLQQYKSHPVWGEFYYICPLDVSEITDIEGDGNGLEIEAIYDLNGQHQPALRPGINIIKMSDGTIKKVMVK